MEPRYQARPEFSAMQEALEEGGAIGRLCIAWALLTTPKDDIEPKLIC